MLERQIREETLHSSPADARQHAKLWELFCAAALLVLVPLFCAPTLTDYLVSDDFRLVGQVDFRTALGYFQQTTGFGRNEYRPLVMVSYAVDNLLWGDRPYGYHLTNVLLHTISSVLLLLVLGRLSGSLFLAFLGATLFAIHPIHHSHVAWICARDGTLSTVFLLLSFLFYLSLRGSLSPRRDGLTVSSRWRKAWRWLSWGAFAMALLSYEGAASFPLLLAAFELLQVRSPASWRERAAATARVTFPYFLLFTLYAAGWLLLFNGQLGAYDLDLSLGGLLRDFYRLHYNLFHHIQHWMGLVYLVMAGLAWRYGKRQWRLLLFSVLVIWIGYLPFLPVRGFADRFAYVSSIGVVLFLGLTLQAFLVGGGRTTARAVLTAIFSLTLILTYARSTYRRFGSWTEAGILSESIPAQLKALRASFPPSATLVFEQIPARRGDSYVFPNSFRVAVRRKYREPVERIFYYPTRLRPSELRDLLKEEPAYLFRYLPEEERLVEVTARSDRSSRLR